MFAALVESGDVLELGYVLLRVEIIIQVDTQKKEKKGASGQMVGFGCCYCGLPLFSNDNNNLSE